MAVDRDPDPTSAPALDVRRADEGDLRYVEALLECHGLPHEDVRSGDGEFFVGYAGGDAVAVGGLERYGEVALLRSVVTAAAERGRGYGRTLVDRLLEYARGREVSEVYLLTTTAAGFFERLDFTAIDRAAAPPAIRGTREFGDLCPDSAVCMKRDIA